MKMARKMMKTIMLFGVKIEALVDVDDIVQNADPPAVIQPRPGRLELPPGARLIAQKKLKDSDVSRVLSRLMIPNCNEIILQVLLDSERSMIVDERKSMRVTVMDCRQRCYVMDFKKWPSLKKFVLNKGWMKLVEANQLKKGDVVKLWCYREDSLLRFVVEINQ